MFLFVAYYTGTSGTNKTIEEARFTEDLLLRVSSSMTHPDLPSNRRCTHFEITGDESMELASKIINDPTHYMVVTGKMSSTTNTKPPELKLGETIVTVNSPPTNIGDPYCRKISNFTDKVRPAILRAGTTSLFANL